MRTRLPSQLSRTTRQARSTTSWATDSLSPSSTITGGGGVAPGQISLGHVAQLGILQDGPLTLAREDGFVIGRCDLVGGQPVADQMGAQSGGGECLAGQLGGEGSVDRVTHLVGPGLHGPSEDRPVVARPPSSSPGRGRQAAPRSAIV